LESVIRPRFEKVTAFFPNATFPTAETKAQSQCSCRFEKTPDFPASTNLSFGVSSDAEVKNAIITYDLEILPIYFQFQGHDQLLMAIGGIDDRCVAAWVESKLLALVDIYVRLQTMDQYQVENQVTDPVCAMRINRAAAVMSASYDGKTYYFCTESCHDRFAAEPGRYINVPIAGAPYSAASQSQQQLKREAEELKNLGDQIQRVKNAVERQYGHQ
jgi:YHS domain-containing protein